MSREDCPPLSRISPLLTPPHAAENCTLKRGSFGSRNLLTLPLSTSKFSRKESCDYSHLPVSHISSEKLWEVRLEKKKERALLGQRELPQEEAQVRFCQRPLTRGAAGRKASKRENSSQKYIPLDKGGEILQRDADLPTFACCSWTGGRPVLLLAGPAGRPGDPGSLCQWPPAPHGVSTPASVIQAQY